jgi:hypothetical protein
MDVNMYYSIEIETGLAAVIGVKSIFEDWMNKFTVDKLSLVYA